MASDLDGRQIISADDYVANWRHAHSTSQLDRPYDAVFYRYVSSVKTFVDDLVFPVWWTDPAQQRFVHHLDDLATPISYRQLLHRSWLCQQILAARAKKSTGCRPVSQVIVEHHQLRGIRVVKDGCKELLFFLVQNIDRPLLVTEVSGTDWSNSLYDMGRIQSQLGDRAT